MYREIIDKSIMITNKILTIIINNKRYCNDYNYRFRDSKRLTY